jgi:DNA-binding LytR/AlgR family response regulator
VTPLRAMIVEDEKPARSYLAELLRGTGQVEIVAAVASVAEARQVQAQALDADVWFVDVRLIDRPGDISGLELVRSLAVGPAAPLLVLATAMTQHALAAFEAGAVDYLVKPFTRQRTQQCVERLLARRPPPAHSAAKPTRLLARSSTSLVFLPVEHVLAFEAADRLTYVHHADGRFLVDLSLAALETQFGPSMVRAHRNWLVAIEHVRRLGRVGGGEVAVHLEVHETKLSVPVSRDRAPAMREALLARSIGGRKG